MSTLRRSSVWTTIIEAVHSIFPNKRSLYVKADQEKEPEPFGVALRTAELALQHAADTGKEIPRELIIPITDAKYGYKHSSLDANFRSEFLGSVHEDSNDDGTRIT